MLDIGHIFLRVYDSVSVCETFRVSLFQLRSSLLRRSYPTETRAMANAGIKEEVEVEVEVNAEKWTVLRWNEVQKDGETARSSEVRKVSAAR